MKQGLSTDLAVSLLMAYSAGEILVALPVGWMADRLDRGHLMTGCAFAAASAVLLLLALSDVPGLAWLIAALAGGTVVSLHNIALILLGERYRGANLPIVSTAFSMAYALGSAGGSAIGGVAMAWLGPRAFRCSSAWRCSPSAPAVSAAPPFSIAGDPMNSRSQALLAEHQAPRVVVVVGLGSIGQSLLPLVREAWPAWHLVAIDQTMDTARREIARSSRRRSSRNGSMRATSNRYWAACWGQVTCC